MHANTLNDAMPLSESLPCFPSPHQPVCPVCLSASSSYVTGGIQAGSQVGTDQLVSMCVCACVCSSTTLVLLTS